LSTDNPRAQRLWRAACPNCGAPVEFRSATSASAVCGFCRSTLVRDGETLRRVGESAELFDDFSPLQLGTTGRHLGETFTLIGRLQYGYAEGTWSEWHALFDTGRSAWLSEDNGRYVLSFEAPLDGAVPAPSTLKPGTSVVLQGVAWQVASRLSARLMAAQGELPRPPTPRLGEFEVVDLRNGQGEVATLEFSVPGEPSFSVGRSASLAELALQGLRTGPSERTLGSRSVRSVNCPQCGAAIELRLASTQSASCHQCHALVDVSSEAGAALASVQQTAQPPAGQAPRLPLGATGRMALEDGVPLDWQVVGYQVREDVPEDGESPTPWSEYLLFHSTAGFAFLVDTADGWSLVRPLTGAPEVRGNRALWEGASYLEKYRYQARVTWVDGEFYWRVQRDQDCEVTDYGGVGSAGDRLLSREQTPDEVTWSGGRTVSAQSVADAFSQPGIAAPAVSPDVKPLAARTAMSLTALFVILFALILLAVLMARCSADDCAEVRRTFGTDSAEARQCERSGSPGRVSGGSYGGYSTGGGHK
jgi:hypothetical protein